MIWQKMMQVSRIHDIMECKNFYERKLTMNLKITLQALKTIHKKELPSVISAL